MTAMLPQRSRSLRSTASAAPGSRRAARTLAALAALGLSAALALPGVASAQGLPQGWTDDTPDAAGETGASQSAGVPGVQQAQDASAPAYADDEYADTDPSALTEWQQPLAPHGSWVDDPKYGVVWVPAAETVGPDFAPYVTAGYWAMSDEGDWIWVSDYEWGDITFHYGRWVWTEGYGWVWIPGRRYAPAWVVWRVGDEGYIGWAPMPPTYYWSSGVAVTFWGAPTAAYVFCPTTHVFHHHVHTYIVRDPVVIRRAAAHTRPYRPASASGASGAPAGGHGRHGASPSGGAHARPGGYRPAAPSLDEAGVPAKVRPKARVAPDARALAYARKSTTPTARVTPPARGLNASPGARPGQVRIPRGLPGAQRPLQAPSAPGRATPPVRIPRPGDGGDAAPTPRIRVPGRDRGPGDGAPTPRITVPGREGAPVPRAPLPRGGQGAAPAPVPAPPAALPAPPVRSPQIQVPSAPPARKAAPKAAPAPERSTPRVSPPPAAPPPRAAPPAPRVSPSSRSLSPSPRHK